MLARSVDEILRNDHHNFGGGMTGMSNMAGMGNMAGMSNMSGMAGMSGMGGMGAGMAGMGAGMAGMGAGMAGMMSGSGGRRGYGGRGMEDELLGKPLIKDIYYIYSSKKLQ